MRIGTFEYIKDFKEIKPEMGGKLIRSSTLGDLTRDSSTETEQENASGSETDEASDIDNHIEVLMDELKKHEDDEVSLSIPTHHEHMVSYDDVKSAIDAMCADDF